MRLALPVVLAFFALTAPALAVSGDRDPEFNGGQYVSSISSPGFDSRNYASVAGDGLGRLYAALDRVNTRVDLFRLRGDGTPDPAWGGGDGLVEESTIGGSTPYAPKLALDGAGQLYAAYQIGPAGSPAGTAVVRYTDTGLRDPDYGTNGIATIPADEGRMQELFVDSSGVATVLLLRNNTSSDPRQLRTARIDDAGIRVASYAPAPITYPAPTATAFSIVRADRDTAGGIIVGGRFSDPATPGDDHLFLLRIGPTGAADATWNGTDGFRKITLGNSGQDNYLTDVAVGPSNQVALVGGISGAGSSSYLIFTQGGATPSLSVQQFPATTFDAVTFQGDGKLLAAGAATGGMRLSRLTTTGNPAYDTTFAAPGDNGQRTDTGPTFSVSQLLRTANGKLVVGGTRGVGNDSADAYLGRFLGRNAGEGPPDPAQPPGLTGTPSPGQTLTCSPGTYGNGGGAPNQPVPRVWERAPRSTTSAQSPAWSAIAGTTGTTYMVTQADLGSRVRCRETPVNFEGSASNPSRSVRIDTGPPVLVRAPTLSGIPVQGNNLTCDVGEWTNAPDLAVQWYRDGAAIPGATETVRGAGRGRLLCEVTATNDVGAAPPERSPSILGVNGVPFSIGDKPAASLSTVGAKATDQRVTCTSGTWIDDYGQYEYAWTRNGAEIAGATGATYDAKVDDLGTQIGCIAYSVNPAGRSEGSASSNTVLVPLPAGGVPGQIYMAGGFNRFDPRSFMAVSKEYLDVIQRLVIARRQQAADRLLRECQTGQYRNETVPAGKWEEWTGPSSVQPVYTGVKVTCAILMREPFAVAQTAGGSYWIRDLAACKVSDLPQTTGTRTCPRLALSVPPLNVSTLDQASANEIAAIKATRPIRTLWDFDNDGQTDASCEPDAPFLRTLTSRGYYTARAVIVNADSEQTGIYSVTDLKFQHFPESTSQKGALREAQPFACKTTMIPPAAPAAPCVNELTIGRAHMTGNLCPISLRRVPEDEIGGLPADVQKMLEGQALNSAADLRRRYTPLPGEVPTGGLRRASTVPGVDDAIKQISALSTIGEVKPETIAKPWEDKLKDVKSFSLDQAQHAMDQIYVVNGGSKLNGVSLDPVGAAKTILVPSDAGKAIDDVKKMTLSSTNLATVLGGVPIGDPGKLVTEFEDKVKANAKAEAGAAAKAVLRGANFDAIAKSLKDKLNLGPFALTGDAKVKLNADGTATIDAYAELPKLLTKPGSKPIRVAVQVNATREGKLTLNGIHLTAPAAYLGAILLKNLSIDYDGNGLSVAGALLFPPVNQGIKINKFRLDSNGNFKELDVDYLAGAGQGINIGPGVFLTKIGGGLSLDPDEIRGRTTVSVGPSPGGGCATAGIDAEFVVHFAPDPFSVSATGAVGLVCIPVGNASFYADSTGVVKIGATVNLDIGPLYIKGAFNGQLILPRWQVDLRGDGGIRHVLQATIKALIGNLGVAGCGRIEVFPETLINDSVTLAGGAGVRFSNGRPPFTYAELLNNIEIFDGCSLASWSPFGKDLRQAGGGGRTFTVAKPAPAVIPLELIGVGGAPKVTLTAPDGKTFDTSAFGEDLTKGDSLTGLVDPGHSRTVAFVRGQAGTWRITPVPGSPALADVNRSSILPEPNVTGKVGGAGASRRLKYSVAKIPGQVVTFSEQSAKGQRVIAVIKGGGKGTKPFITSEGGGTARKVVAQIAQDGLPRDNVTVATFTAPSPRAAKPKLRLRRKGAKVTATWSKAFYAKAYVVSVQTGRGKRFTLTPKARTVSFGGLAKGESATVSVTSIAPSGAHGGTATKALKGSKRYTSFKNVKRRRPAGTCAAKRKHHSAAAARGKCAGRGAAG